MRFTFTIEEEQHRALVERAEKTGVPVAEQVRRGVGMWLESARSVGEGEEEDMPAFEGPGRGK